MQTFAHNVVGCMTVAMLLPEVHCLDHVVTFSDAAIWTVGFGVTYPDMSITLGETLKFASDSSHDVVLLHTPTDGTHWEQCGMQGIADNAFTTIWGGSDFSHSSVTEKHYTPQTCGDFYIACSVPPHCAYGQRVKVSVKNTDSSACTSQCANAACVPDASKDTVATSSLLREVKPAPNSQYWGSSALYDAITVNLGDTVTFRTGAGYHDVATVPSAADLSACEMNGKVVLAEWDATSGKVSAACDGASACCADSSCGAGADGMSVTYKFSADAAGETHFVCSVGSHCQTGQKFSLTVVDPNTASSAYGRNHLSVKFFVALSIAALLNR